MAEPMPGRLRVPDWLRRPLHPAPVQWAIWAAARALLAAGAIALFGTTTHHLAAAGLMYFGAACAVAFVSNGVYRTRLVALAAQGLGAAAGLGVGALWATSDVGKVVVATAAGLVCGMIGAVGRQVTAFALMMVIGISYEQFSGVPLPWLEKAGWYLAGTSVVSLAAIFPLLLGRRDIERAAIADVYGASADLLDAIGAADAHAKRRALAEASAVSRAAMHDNRLRRVPRRAAANLQWRQMRGAELASLASASLYSQGQPVPRAASGALRCAEAAVRNATEVPPVEFAADSLGLRALAGALESARRLDIGEATSGPRIGARAGSAFRAALAPESVAAGVRLAWCMGLATALTVVLHQSSHSYWLPLTVAVVVRPEYASVFVRTVNRVVGSIGGAVFAAIALLILPGGWPVAVAASLSIGWAILSVPKLYALSVIGITGSALLSASLGTEDPVYPALRLLDTLAGCGVAIVFGYLLWPGRRELPRSSRPVQAIADTIAYLRQAARPPADRQGWPAVRDRAYVSAHHYRASLQAALAEPPPVSTLAERALPEAVTLEDLADGITALDDQVRRGAGSPAPSTVEELAHLIAGIDAVPRHSLDAPLKKLHEICVPNA
jgi:uncharacterized membrane protein YccC